MKILITTDLYTTKTNGVVTSVRNLTNELLEMGHDVRILTFSETKRSRIDANVYCIASASLQRIYPNLRMPIRYRHRYIKELIQWKPDIIHSQCEFFSFQFAKVISKHTDAPIIHTYHSLYEQYVPYLIPSQRLGEFVVRTFTKKRLKKVDTVIAPTKKVETVLRGYGVTRPVSIVPSGIDLAQHKNRLSCEQRSQIRNSMGISDDELVLLNLGRLGKEKNIDELLTLFAALLSENTKLKFLIVGDGPSREDLENIVRQKQLQDHVIFTGMIPPEQVQDYYQLADVFVSASTSETQGLTYVEAAANGLPLLCRDDLCLDGVLIQGENGFSYTNPDEFSAGLRNLQQDREFSHRAGEKSSEIAQEFSCELFGKKVMDIYREALSNTHPVH